MPKFTTTEVIGVTASVIAVANIFTIISTISIPVGIQRFLGKFFAEQNIENAKVFVKTALILISIGILASSVIIFIGYDWISNFFGVDYSLLFITILLIASIAFFKLFRAIIISFQKTKMLAITVSIASVTKIALGIFLVSLGTGVFGVAIGFTSFFTVSAILLAVTSVIILKTSKKKVEFNFKHSAKNILNASIASWVPGLIYVLAINVGTIVVYGIQGAHRAGVYFIAFSISAAIMGIMLAMLEFAFPILSGMKHNRKKVTWRIIKVSLVFILPISSTIMFFPEDVLQFFGESYVEGSFTLQILMISVLPMMVGQGVRFLVYAYGNYKQFLWLGMASSVPTIILYFILVPIYGGMGAGMSITTGSIILFTASIFIAKKVKFQIFWKDLILILAIPSIMAFVLNYIELNLILSAFVIVISSYLFFIRLGIVTREDLQDSLGVLPKNIAVPVLNTLNRIAKKINPSF